MALPSSQPVTSLLCGGTKTVSRQGEPVVGERKRVWVGEEVGAPPRPVGPRPRDPGRLVSPGRGDYWGSVRSRGPSGSSGRGGPRPRAGRGRTPGRRAGCGC